MTTTQDLNPIKQERWSRIGPLKLSARDDIDHALAQPVLAKRDAFLPDVSPHHHVKRSPAPQTPLFSAEESNAVAQQILDIMAFPLNEDSSLFAEDRNLLIAQVSLLKTLPASAPHIDKIERLEEALNQIGVSEPGGKLTNLALQGVEIQVPLFSLYPLFPVMMDGANDNMMTQLNQPEARLMLEQWCPRWIRSWERKKISLSCRPSCK